MNWLKINKTEEISEQTHNNKTYSEILKLLKEDERIADYPLLQKLRNENIDKRFENFWVFVSNPDVKSKSYNYIAWLGAISDGAGLNCYRDASFTDSSLGVFLVRKIKRVEICTKCKEEIK